MKRKQRSFDIKAMKFDKKGLIPAIIQDYKTKEVLMLAYMNKESLRRTITLNKTCFWSRSRKEYWVKGMTSGHYQYVKSISYDCDSDALLIKVRQVGVACHTGNRSCFYRRIK
ncbi:MAG: phosphoribosyl-AMP cyclohydrolase [Candidatus Omnitrophota bacterium]|nr:MAG: phosphoribosyl-AMP cyclohydrolase [Candidatus Omnitrophota bacterium]